MQFNQPDTLVPDPGNPADYNRYSYVRYNPLRFTDPSGYLLCSEMPWEEDCDPDSDGQIKSEARRGGLTPWGERMLELFLEYRKTDGFWNEDGDFTLEDFLTLTLYLEYADTPTEAAADFEEAVGAKMSWWCAHENCSNTSAAMLNYIGTRSGMRSRYWDSRGPDGKSLEELTTINPKYDWSNAAIMSQNAIDSLSWRTGEVSYDGPWDWGNLSMFPVNSRAAMANIDDFTLAVNSVIYRYGTDLDKAFVIVSYNQEKYWKGED